MALVAQFVSAWDSSNRAQFLPAWAEESPPITIAIHDDFERSCVDVSLSEVTTDTDDVLLIKLRPRMQTITTQGNAPRWLEPVAKITGALGLQPRIEIVPYVNAGFANNANHQPWSDSNQRGHYSYDGETWTPFDTLLRVDRLRWRNNTAFTQDTVYVARSWPWSVTQCGNWVQSLATSHSTKIAPLPSALAFTPSLTTSFPAQDYICAEVSAKTDELGRAIHATPIYGFKIDDQAYSPTKRAVIYAGVHAGEDVGEIVFRETIAWLLGSSAEAIAIRQKYVIHVYPLINPAGRYAGYWRGAPGSNTDTNRDWYATTPDHESTATMKALTLADLGGAVPDWGIDFHASPDGARMQMGSRTLIPASVAWYDAARARYPAGAWAVYGLASTNPPYDDGNLKKWWLDVVGMRVPMLVETCDRPGPISPAIAEPYAAAIGGAVADLDAAGWFDEAPAGTLTLGTPSVTSSSISLPWTYSAADHDGIEYRYRLTAGTWSAWIDAGLVSPIEITGLTSSAEYEIEAQAYNSAGAGTPQTVTVTVWATAAVSPSRGRYAVSGHAPAVLHGDAQAIAPQAGHAQAHGYAPTIGQAQTIAPTRAQAVAAGHAPIVVKGVRVDPQTGRVEFAGHAPTIAQGGARTVAPVAGHVRALGWVPSVTTTPIGGYPSSVTITVPSGRTITLRPR